MKRLAVGFLVTFVLWMLSAGMSSRAPLASQPRGYANGGLSCTEYEDPVDPAMNRGAGSPITWATFTTPVRTTIWTEINHPPHGYNAHVAWSMKCSGQLLVPVTGTYTFYTSQDDGLRVFVDGAKMLDRWIVVGSGLYDARFTMTLSAGLHNFYIEFAQGLGPDHIIIEWAGPGFGREVITAAPVATPTFTPTPTPTFTPTPTPTPLPPSVDVAFACAQPGQNGWCRGGAELSWNATVPGGGTVSGDWGDGTTFSQACSGSCADSYVPGDGTGTAQVTAASAWGAASDSASWAVDTTVPVLNPSMPSPDGQSGWFVTAPVQVDASGSDATSGLAALECRVDGGAWQPPPVTVSGDGAHTVECQAQDRAGNVSTWSETVQIDTTAPVLNPSMPSSDGQNGWFVTAPVQVDASGSDATSGLAALECRVDGGAWQPPPVTVSGDGAHTVECQAQDRAGNVSTWSETVQIDTTAPDSTFLSPAEGAVVWGIVPLRGESHDAASGVATVEVSTDAGTTWAPVSLTGTVWMTSWDTRRLPDGVYTLMARARDEAGNAEQTAIVHVTVANGLPKVTLNPARWPFWETARVHVQANAYTPVERVKVTIVDTYKPGRVRVWEYQPLIRDQETFIIDWNGRWFSERGPAAGVGEYAVKVQVWDTYGRQAATAGTVVVPPPAPSATPTPFPSATSTPLLTPTLAPTPTATPTSLAPARQETRIAPTATMQISRPFATPGPSPVAPSPAPLDAPEGPPLALLAAVALAVGVLALRDPRIPEVARWREMLRQSRQGREESWDTQHSPKGE